MFKPLCFVLCPVLIAFSAWRSPLCGQSPRLQDTLSWIANTLRPQEGNAVYTIKPPFESPDNLKEQIDSYHREFISDFSHTGTKVSFTVIVTDNDMGLLLGLHLEETQV